MVQQWRQGIWYITTGAAFTGAILFPALPSAAQLLQDNSLGAESSVITPGVDLTGQPANLIGGGARRGENLFHSFQEFNVGNLQRVFFTNPAGVENIVSRVTGTNPSNILGTLGVLGEANLFLLNPNGILFGPGATLNINGSFVASTANSVRFANGIEFSAVDPATPPLLTINTPVGLQYGSNPGNIRVQNSALQVGQRSSLTLLGGSVSMRGGQLTATGGRVELGGLAEAGTVPLLVNSRSNILSSDFPDRVQRGNVSLSNGASVNVLASRGGSIVVNTRNLDISDGGILGAGIGPDLGSVGTVAGDVNVDATGVITLQGSSVIRNVMRERATGNAGNINIQARSLNLLSGSQLFTSTYGRGNAGTMNVNVQDMLLIDSASNNVSGSSIINSVAAGGRGNGGEIRITTGSFILTNGGQINAITEAVGSAGTVTIDARDHISLDGENINGAVSSIISSVSPGARGGGGRIRITTGSFTLTNGANINATTQGIGNAGAVTINARDRISLDGENSTRNVSGIFSSVVSGARGNGGGITITGELFSATRGAGVYATTEAQGDAGNVRINAHEVLLDGANSNAGVSGIYASVVPNGMGDAGEITITGELFSATRGAGVYATTEAQGDAGNVTINVRDRIFIDGTNSSGGASGIFSNVGSGAVGDGREVRISAGELFITNGARLSTSSAGDGSAGNIEVDTDSIRLINGTIVSDSRGGQGNITLRSPLLVFRDDSTITTIAEGTATGGNIDINADFLVAATNENNDIIANAFEGSGGQITLTAQGIFGFEVQTREDLQRLLNTTNPDELTPRRLVTNDITAFSQANPTIDTGAVTVRTPDLDPARGLTALPSDFTDSSQLIATTCPVDQGSSFAVTGRGGLPEDPRQPLMGQVVWEDERGEERGEVGEMEEVGEVAIAEAQGWVVDRAGRVVLVAQQPQANSSALPEYWPCISSSQE